MACKNDSGAVVVCGVVFHSEQDAVCSVRHPWKRR